MVSPEPNRSLVDATSLIVPEKIRQQLRAVIQRLIEESGLHSRDRSDGAMILVEEIGEYLCRVQLARAEQTVILTSRQKEILALLGRDLGNKGIARSLGISQHTVKTHLRRIMDRTAIHSRAGLVRYATGLADQED